MTTRGSYAHGTFCWVDLMAHDMAGAKDFYCQLFDWTALEQDTQGGPPYAIFRHGEHQVAGMGGMPDEMKNQGTPPLWNSYVNVDDIDAICGQVAELGGTVTMPVMDVLDAGRMASIADPTGASVMLWQKGNHYGASLVNDVGAFCWNELATRDLAKAKSFFSDLFGWEYELNENSPSTYFVIKNPHQREGNQMNGGIIEMNEQWGDSPPHWVVYFTVADADAACSKIKELGGGVHVPAFDVDIGRIAVVSDPQGATFSVIQMSVPPD